MKIEKTTTGDSASWVSDNMCDIWSPTHTKNVDIFLGAWVRTQGVNVNPATEDAKWYLAYEFYDSAGAQIGDVQAADPQTVASTGALVADTNESGRVDPAEGLVEDDHQVRGGEERDGDGVGGRLHVLWSCGPVGRSGLGHEPGIPTGWYYWLPPNGGNDGVLANGFENTVVTTEAAHSGLNSLKFNLPFDRADLTTGSVGMRRVPLDPSHRRGDDPPL